MYYVTDRAAGIGKQHAKLPHARDQLIAALLLVPCPCYARPPQLTSISLAVLTVLNFLPCCPAACVPSLAMLGHPN